jgi:hypothetical protein
MRSNRTAIGAAPLPLPYKYHPTPAQKGDEKGREDGENRKRGKQNRERKERIWGSLKQRREFEKKINREYKGRNHLTTKEEKEKKQNTRGEGKSKNLSLRRLK